MTDEDRAEAPAPDVGELDEEHRKVAIAGGIIAAVAKNTALEVEGVSGLAATLPERVKHILGAGFAGVAVEFVDERTVRIDLHLEVDEGRPLPEVAHEVKDKVAEKVAGVSGLSVGEVVVHIDRVGGDGA